MPGLFSALDASSGTLDAYERALDVTQNNVSNSSTPGYASQTALFDPLPFDPVDGPSGGVQFGGTQDMRDESAERYVQQQFSDLGLSEQMVSSLSSVEPAFDVTGQTGIDAEMNQFFQSFSALSANPNDPTAQQQAISAAQSVAASFKDASSSLEQASASADQQIQTTISQINNDAAQIQSLNQKIADSPQPDANLQASLHSTLESLSELVNFTTSFAPNGSVSVLIGGQTPLVLGTTVDPISSGLAPSNPNAAYPGGTPAQMITDQNGQDITQQITGGNLAGLLQVRNVVLPGIIGDTTQQGTLNQLAQSFVDRVNTLLTNGEISAGPPAVPGVTMFQYDATNPTTIAKTLATTSITADQIASIDPGPPYSANGTAQAIANLATSSSPADQINGQTFAQFYGQIASAFGLQISNAQTEQQTQTQTLAQARNLRSQVSGVSLDQEAVQLIEFQRAYEATSKLVTVLDDLTQTTINLIPS